MQADDELAESLAEAEPGNLLLIEVTWTATDLATAWLAASRVHRGAAGKIASRRLTPAMAVAYAGILLGLPALGWFTAARGVSWLLEAVLILLAFACLILALGQGSSLDRLEKQAASTVLPEGEAARRATVRVGPGFVETRVEGLTQRWNRAAIIAVLEGPEQILLLPRGGAVLIPRRDLVPATATRLKERLLSWGYPAITPFPKAGFSAWFWFALFVLLTCFATIWGVSRPY